MLKYRKQMVITLPFDLYDWVEEQSRKECRFKSQFMECLVVKYKKEQEMQEKDK